MALLDPKERCERGRAQWQTIMNGKVAEPETLYESSWPDYLMAEVWTRPGLDLRSRYLISIASAASADTPEIIIDGYVGGALVNEHLSVSELREAAMHFAVYGGWSRGAIIDRAISRVVEEQKITETPYKPLCDTPWDPADRLTKGATEFDAVMTFGGPPPVAPYFETGILNFVFGEMWHRDGLDQRSRRWITLVGVADSSMMVPIQSHIYGAMASGNCTAAEMHEFVLQYAVHSGWPRASYLQGVVFDMAKRVEQGLTWDGKTRENTA